MIFDVISSPMQCIQAITSLYMLKVTWYACVLYPSVQSRSTTNMLFHKVYAMIKGVAVLELSDSTTTII